MVVSFGWLDGWYCGDISSAFLQGKPSEGNPLYMKQPAQGIPGVKPQQVFRLKRPVYGRPDAPRAWYESLSEFIIEDMGYERSIIDPALFVRRKSSGEPRSVIVIHVDDLMMAGEDDDDYQEAKKMLCKRFPFGEWERVIDKKEGITYCGKEIKTEGTGISRCIRLGQDGFIDGRLDTIPVSRERSKQKEESVTEEERTDFRSVLGSLQWLATQTRGDLAFSVNQLQKRVNQLQVKDLLVANSLVKVVKENRVQMVFRNLGKDVSVVCWHDASLYNSLGVEVEDQEDQVIQNFNDKKWFYSQKGVITGFVRNADLDRTDNVPVNFISWKSKTNKRVIESSFASETHGAIMGHQNGHHLRALYAEVCHGSWVIKENDTVQWNQIVPLIQCTDCRSVYDCISKDSHSIGDRGVSINVAILRELSSTQNQPSGDKSSMLWVPTRHQCADGLTKGGKHGDLIEILKNGMAVFQAFLPNRCVR